MVHNISAMGGAQFQQWTTKMTDGPTVGSDNEKRLDGIKSSWHESDKNKYFQGLWSAVD